ncbi:uncharacterized protein Dvir_GJ15224 [Drosophila virilis]|uniref:Uncharacterized protein n=1 Tax=Drosophila virilis TaxID=7244 RepID=B4MD09_DROVI|nr:uncharacterized protein Dvir_GJ15224 [Drosophila virilis]
MHANHSRLIKIFLVIISIKLFLILVLFAYNNSNVNRFRPRRMVFIDELLIDKSETPSWQERLKLIREEMPSFPLEELTHRPPLKPSCGLVPSVLGIDYSNDYWQMVRVANLTYYLFGAYYDNREKMTEAPLVRVLTMINLYAKHHEVKYPETFCQLWYKNRVEPIVVSVTDHRLIWFWGGGPPQVFPTLLSCPLPKKNGTNVEEVPEMVSLVTERCEKARNLLRVVYERDLQLNGVQYLSGNALSSGAAQLPRPIPRPVVRPLRPPYDFLQQQPPLLRPGLGPHPSPATLPLLLQQSKQFAYAPMPQRNYAPAPRIPLPYPPSFVSITTRSPASGHSASHSKPFRPSQPDLTPDLFAGRDSKSLLDSYIPSWEVLRLYQQHQSPRPFQRHTLAYAVPSLRVFKRDSKLDRSSERSRIVKKSLDKQLNLR